MKQKIDTLLQETIERLETNDSAKDVERLRIDVLGRKGTLSHLFKKLGESPAKERPVLGKILNETRARLESAFEEATAGWSGRPAIVVWVTHGHKYGTELLG